MNILISILMRMYMIRSVGPIIPYTVLLTDV